MKVYDEPSCRYSAPVLNPIHKCLPLRLTSLRLPAQVDPWTTDRYLDLPRDSGPRGLSARARPRLVPERIIGVNDRSSKAILNSVGGVVSAMATFAGVLGAAGMVAVGPLSAASAQVIALPPELVTDPDLSAEELAQVRAFIDEHAPALLRSADREKLKAARLALVTPLANPAASAPFRIGMAAALDPTLTQMMVAKEDLLVINALVISGELATPTALSRLTAALSNEKEEIRYQAAYGLRRAFLAMQGGTPAVRSDQADDAITAIGNQLAREEDAIVIDGLVAAGLAAIGVDRHRNIGITQVSVGLIANARAAGANVRGEAYANALLRACSGVRDALGKPGGAAAPTAAKQAAELAGAVIAHARNVVQASKLPTTSQGGDKIPAVREGYAQAIGAASQLLQLAGTTLNANARLTLPDLVRSLRAGTVQADTQFALDAETIVGGGAGVPALARPPFEFPANHFVR